MILTCPECATRYQTDASHFSPDGRKVRCAKCGHVWFQAPPAPEPEIESFEEAPEPPPEPVIPQRAAYAQPASVHDALSSDPPRPRARWPERIGLAFGWAALAAILLVIGWSALRYRQDIASLWPQSSTFYKAVGMSVNTRGIAFRDRNAHFEKEDGLDVLVITGNLVNTSSHELSVPPIRVSLSDADKRELYHWNFAPGVATLRAGQAAPFRTRLSSPPPALRNVELRFAEHSN